MKEYFNQLVLAGIMGISSLGVSYMRDLSKEVQTISSGLIESRTESNLKFKELGNDLADHELRLREMERELKNKRR